MRLAELDDGEPYSNMKTYTSMRTIGIEKKIPVTLYRIALGVRFRMLNIGSPYQQPQYTREHMVAGNCGLASEALEESIDEAEMTCGNFHTDRGWEGHCWVEWRGCVLDVTADQFNCHCSRIKMKPIVFCHKSKLKNIYSEDEFLLRGKSTVVGERLNVPIIVGKERTL
jgi:hypothetical protein